MRRIGSINGIYFCFDSHTLSGIEVVRHKKLISAFREKLICPKEFSISAIEEPCAEIFETINSNEGESIPDEFTFISISQNLGTGKRSLKIYQHRAEKSSRRAHASSFNTLSAALDVVYNLENDFSWQFEISHLDKILESQPQRLKIQLWHKILVEISTTESFEITSSLANEPGISVQLPKGHSEIRFRVSSMPEFDFAETIVVCKPDQLQEAGVVISCMQSDRFRSLVVLDPPPISVAEYKNLYRKFCEVDNKFRELNGITKSGFERFSDNFKETEHEMLRTSYHRNQLQTALTPFRSWMKHNKMLGYIISQGGFMNCIFLFPFFDKDYPTGIIRARTDLMKDKDLSEYKEEYELIPEHINRVYFTINKPSDAIPEGVNGKKYCYDRLEDLTDIAWKHLSPAGVPPQETINILPNDCSSLFTSLYKSLCTGVPLRVVAEDKYDSNAAATRGIMDTAVSGRSEEAVLVECINSASQIVGVVYAHYRKASLIISPQPDLSSVEELLLSYRQRQEEDSKALSYLVQHSGNPDVEDKLSPQLISQLRSVSRPDAGDWISKSALYDRSTFLEAFRSFFYDDWQTKAIKEIEKAVSEQVPQYVISGVGDRPVTAFTCGLPYTFVNKASVSWKDKAIGHVINDTSLIILREIYEVAVTQSAIEFNLLYDPGFFLTSETEDVLKTLKKSSSHTMLLSGSTASTDSLLTFSEGLPIEIIFFNTHGSDNAILLHDLPLHHSRISQWFSFSSHPIIFNNSCISWTGVGREFIRVGARGYIGTLWSVNANDAADFARIVVKRMTEEGAQASAAIGNTHVKATTSRAYIFVGTANTAINKSGSNFQNNQRESLIAAATILLNSVPKFKERGQIKSELYELLLGEAVKFIEALESISTSENMDVIDIRLKELSIINSAVEKSDYNMVSKYDLRYALGITARYIEQLNKSHYPDKMRFARLASLFYLSGNFNWINGDLSAAITELKESIRLAKEGKSNTYRQYILLCEIYKHTGEWEDAKEAALLAKESARAKNDRNDLMIILGSLGQIYKRLHEAGAAMECAQEGYELAVEVDDVREQAIFKADQAFLFNMSEEYDKAIANALESVRLSAKAMEPLIVLKANGIITRSYISKGDLKKARCFAQNGLTEAKKLNNLNEFAAFLQDMAEIEIEEGAYEKGIDYYIDAASVKAKIFHTSELALLFRLIADAGLKSNEIELIYRGMVFQIALLVKQNEGAKSTLIPFVIFNLKEIAFHVAKDKLPVLFNHFLNGLWSLIGPMKDKISVHLQFLNDFLYTSLTLFQGDQEKALKYAEDLDIVSKNTLELTAFFKSYLAGQEN